MMENNKKKLKKELVIFTILTIIYYSCADYLGINKLFFNVIATLLMSYISYILAKFFSE